VSIKDAFEVFMKMFHGTGTQLMKAASHFDPVISMGIASISGRNVQTVISLTEFMEVRSNF
jgi:hypothetical protein